MSRRSRHSKGTISSVSCNPATNGFALTESYVLGQSGEHISELDGSGNFLRGHVYANGHLLATYTNTGTEFAFNDWLGSKRVVANADGSVAGTCINLPFGDELSCSGTVPLNGHHFTGQIHDQESANDYFSARYYSENTGRFLSPDALGGHLEDPQTLNRYSYVGNNPLSRTDPTGLDFYLQCQTASDTCFCLYDRLVARSDVY
jgi:RHS repeat-associated protein